VTLKIDNVYAINLAKNPISHERSNHIYERASEQWFIEVGAAEVKCS
jgi:hypothetical protein